MKLPPMVRYLQLVEDFQSEAMLCFRYYVRECRNFHDEAGGREGAIRRQRKEIKDFPKQFREWAKDNCDSYIEILCKRETGPRRSEPSEVHQHVLLSRRLTVNELALLERWFSKKTKKKPRGARKPLKYQVIGEGDYGKLCWEENVGRVKSYMRKADKKYEGYPKSVNVINMCRRIGDKEVDVGRFYNHFKINPRCVTEREKVYPFTDSPFFGGGKQDERLCHCFPDKQPVQDEQQTVYQKEIEPISEGENRDSLMRGKVSAIEAESKMIFPSLKKAADEGTDHSLGGGGGEKNEALIKWVTEPDDAWTRGEMDMGINADGTPFIPYEVKIDS